MVGGIQSSNRPLRSSLDLCTPLFAVCFILFVSQIYTNPAYQGNLSHMTHRYYFIPLLSAIDVLLHPFEADLGFAHGVVAVMARLGCWSGMLWQQAIVGELLKRISFAERTLYRGNFFRSHQLNLVHISAIFAKNQPIFSMRQAISKISKTKQRMMRPAYELRQQIDHWQFVWLWNNWLLLINYLHEVVFALRNTNIWS